MAAMNSQSFASGTPVPITPSAGSPGTDTIDASQFGPNGCVLRCITAGTVSTVTVLDPGKTAASNPGTPTGVTLPATGARMIPVPLAAIDPATQKASVTSSSQTGLTYELYRY